MWTTYLTLKLVILSAMLALFPETAPPLLGWGIVAGFAFLPLIAWLEHLTRAETRNRH